MSFNPSEKPNVVFLDALRHLWGDNIKVDLGTVYNVTIHNETTTVRRCLIGDEFCLDLEPGEIAVMRTVEHGQETVETPMQSVRTTYSRKVKA